MVTHALSRRLVAEFIGTFWLVLGGRGSAGVVYPRAFGAKGTAPEKPAIGAEGHPGT
jgi:glycerol uptake facilitator-like aquaporin